MDWVQRAVDATNAFFGNKKNRIGLIVLAALMIPLAMLALVDEMHCAMGGKCGQLFAYADDRYADLIKSSLAYQSITAPLANSAKIAAWPELFRNYFYHNPYNGPDLTRFHAPPFAALTLITAAKIIVATDPTFTAFSYFTFYCLLVGLAVALFRVASNKGPILDSAVPAVLLLISYPALFMLTRGNFGAGYTSVCLVIYVLTVFSRQYRWLGLFCLAIAVNLRPNAAAIGILELVAGRSARECVLSIAALAVLSLAIAGGSYLIVHAADPEYTLANFLRGYRIYTSIYVVGNAGMEWNFSLFGVPKLLESLFKMPTVYHPSFDVIFSVVGAMVALDMIYLALTRRVSKIETVFLGTAFSMLFTPVFAFYHMLDFAAPLLAILAVKGDRAEIGDGNSLILVALLASLCPINAELALYGFYALAIFGVMLKLLYEAGRRPFAWNRALVS